MTTETRKTIDDLLATLKQKLATPGQSLLPVLAAMGRFSKYSLSNQLLIYAQRPSASRVQGYQGWRKAGYQVRKGEKGIMIYAPMRFRTDDAESDDDAPRVGFRVTYVFDITQVDPLDGAIDLPSPAPAAPLRALEQLKAFLFGHNLEVAYAALSGGCYGYTDGKRITCALGLSSPVEFSTLIHETTHALLHFPADRSQRPDLTTRETEAEAVAYLLCEQLGIPGHDISIDYIKAYCGTPDTLDASLERIRSTAARLAAALASVSFEPPETPA
jgi:antirestriction protein ArdC